LWGGDSDDVPVGPFDLVTCLGVTVCIIDPRKWDRLIARFGTIIAPGGHLVMIDTVGVDHELLRTYRDGRIGMYRENTAYERAITSVGFERIHTDVVERWPSGEAVNRIWLFRRV